jgi:hypothetical protein
MLLYRQSDFLACICHCLKIEFVIFTVYKNSSKVRQNSPVFIRENLNFFINAL